MFDLSFSWVSSDNGGRFLAVGLFLMGMLSMSDSLANALLAYVHEPDTSFAWKRIDQKKIKDATISGAAMTRGKRWPHGFK